MKSTVSRTFALLFALRHGFVLAQDTCGPLGNRNNSQVREIREQRFYLDINNPAPCTGNITNWRVCYYGPEAVHPVGSYWATYGIYRRMGSNSESNERYERVSEIFSAIRTVERYIGVPTVDGEIEQGGFNCYEDTRDAGDSLLTVQTGDVLGSCVFDPDGDSFSVRRLPLDIVGEVSGESLLAMNTNGCDRDDLPISIPINDLSSISSRRLHLYASIEPILSPTTASDKVNDGVISPGAIAGIILGLLLLLVLGVAVTVIVVFLVKHRQAGKEHSREDNVPSQVFHNLTYGTGAERSVKGEFESDKVGVYEVPENSTINTHNSKSEPEYVASASTYAVPNVYEYATQGPNEVDIASNSYYSALDEATISYSTLLEKNKQEDIYGSVEVFLQPADGENELYAQIRACGIRNIPTNLIQTNGHLGSGQFGFVEKGVWRDGAKTIPVALKLLKHGSSEIDKVRFLQEAAIMAQFKHPNVVSLYGVVSNGESLTLVVELIEKGDLRNYLHTLRPDPGELPVVTLSRLLLSFSQQVALGMQYLSAKGFVHRDLAARNILVSKDNICKVADFGMSRDLADETYYVSQGGKVPVKWTSPEAIHYKKYSTASDVWSYGCLLYEIWSLGYKPFEGLGNVKVVEIVDSGNRLPSPPGCSRLIYEIMIMCWNPMAANRPSFREILLSLIDNPDEVLSIPEEALVTHPLAGVLGSPLEAGENLYHDLRVRYLANDIVYEEMNSA